MSRRKQLHPKPIKGGMTEELEELTRRYCLPSNVLHLCFTQPVADCSKPQVISEKSISPESLAQDGTGSEAQTSTEVCSDAKCCLKEKVDEGIEATNCLNTNHNEIQSDENSIKENSEIGQIKDKDNSQNDGCSDEERLGTSDPGEKSSQIKPQSQISVRSSTSPVTETLISLNQSNHSNVTEKILDQQKNSEISNNNEASCEGCEATSEDRNDEDCDKSHPDLEQEDQTNSIIKQAQISRYESLESSKSTESPELIFTKEEGQDHIRHIREAESKDTDRSREGWEGLSIEEGLSVHSISTIVAGSQFGPFNCTLLSSAEQLNNHETDSCVLKFSQHGSDSVAIQITDDSGRWLKLLRTTSDLKRANCSLILQDGSTAWCQVTRNIPPDTELITALDQSSLNMTSSNEVTSKTSDVTHTPSHNDRNTEDDVDMTSPMTSRGSADVTSRDRDRSPEIKEEQKEVRVKSESGYEGVEQKWSKVSTEIRDHRAIIESESLPFRKGSYSLIHVCMFCGVKFSSPRTLQAHITNYCSKKPLIDPPALHPSLSAKTIPPFLDPSRSFELYERFGLLNNLNLSGFTDRDVTRKRTSDEEDHSRFSHHKKEKLNKKRTGSPDSAKSESSHTSGHLDRQENSTIKMKLNSPTELLSSPRSDDEGQRKLDPSSGDSDPEFRCPLCIYTTRDRMEIMLHARLHYTIPCDFPLADPLKSPWLQKPSSGSTARPLYCAECDIKFSSYATFKGHKEFYCQKRQQPARVKDTSRSKPSDDKVKSHSDTVKTPTATPKVSPFLPGSPPVFIPPYLFPGADYSAFGAAGIPAMLLSPSPFFPGAVSVGKPESTQTSQHTPSTSKTRAITPSSSDLDESSSSCKQIKKETKLIKSRDDSLDDAEKTSQHSTSEEAPLDLSRKKEDDDEHDLQVKHHERSFRRSSSSRASNSPVRYKQSPPEPKKEIHSKLSHPPFLPLPNFLSLPTYSPHAVMLKGKGGHASESILPSVGPSYPPTSSISKCHECNIVFYKLENYIAHKEHYCASRQSKILGGTSSSQNERTRPKSNHSDDDDDDNDAGASAKFRKHSPGRLSDSSMSPRSRNSSSAKISPKSSTPELVATLDNGGVLQYYCISCKIKFSNLDTLKAHKKFYCPSRPSASTSTPTNQAASSPNGRLDSLEQSTSPSESDQQLCKLCGNVFASAQLMRLHFCTGATGMLSCPPLFRCPYCDHIAQSDSRLVEHIKAHAPSKAYRCAMCGYRGNTVRGMRMHGKMHNDAGEPFTDECMVEYEEPPSIPKRLRLTSDILPGMGSKPGFTSLQSPASSAAALEAELIRLKNEPYKRRRSRKAYEKTEYSSGSHPGRGIPTPGGPVRCRECGAMLPDKVHLQVHMQGHVESMLAWKASLEAVKSNKQVSHDGIKSEVMYNNNNMHEDDEELGLENNEVRIKRRRISENSSERQFRDVERDGWNNSPAEEERMGEEMDVNHRLDDREDGLPDRMDYSPPGTVSMKQIKQETEEVDVEDEDEYMKQSCNNLENSKKSSAAERLRMSESSQAADLSNDRNVHSNVNHNNTLIKEEQRSVDDNIEHDNDIDNDNTFDNKHNDNDTDRNDRHKTGSWPTTEHFHKTIKRAPSLSPSISEPSAEENSADKRTSANESSRNEVMNGDTLCKQCNISFIHMSTYLAHKKYYCSSHSNENINGQSHSIAT